MHQLENSKQSKLAGKPAWRKQDATCTLQEEKAAKQEFESLKAGIGVEHQFPHLYSQVGVGVVVNVEVQRDAVVLVEARRILEKFLGSCGRNSLVDVVGGDEVMDLMVVEDVSKQLTCNLGILRKDVTHCLM